MSWESDFSIHVFHSHDVLGTFVLHFTCTTRRRGRRQHNNTGLLKQKSMQTICCIKECFLFSYSKCQDIRTTNASGIFFGCLTTVQAACCARRDESHKHIQRSLFQSSSNPQLQSKVYFQTAPEPEMQKQIKKRVGIFKSKRLGCRVMHDWQTRYWSVPTKDVQTLPWSKSFA